MELFTHWLLPCFWAFLSCVGFSLVFNLRGRMILWCSAGGAVGWLFYLITGALGGGDILQNFVAIVVITTVVELLGGADVVHHPPVGAPVSAKEGKICYNGKELLSS